MHFRVKSYIDNGWDKHYYKYIKISKKEEED